MNLTSFYRHTTTLFTARDDWDLTLSAVTHGLAAAPKLELVGPHTSPHQHTISSSQQTKCIPLFVNKSLANQSIISFSQTHHCYSNPFEILPQLTKTFVGTGFERWRLKSSFVSSSCIMLRRRSFVLDDLSGLAHENWPRTAAIRFSCRKFRYS